MSKSAIKLRRITCGERSRTIGITMGDPKGIGPEVIRKALRSQFKNVQFVCIGDKSLLRNLSASIVDVPYKTQGEGSLKFLNKGIELIKGNMIDALVTAPLSKEHVSRYAKGFCGHTEYLADAFDVKQFDMMFVSKNVRLSLVTRHLPLKEVPGMITKRAVYSSIELMDQTLRSQFNIKDPKIAVLGLNPHAGENGLLGKEEQRFILPAIIQAKANQMDARGPFPADTFFIKLASSFDGVIAMYHDQGLAPLKGMYFKELVNYTAGLPFVRTSPVHGTGFDIAGKNVADPSSMIAAIQLACQLS